MTQRSAGRTDTGIGLGTLRSDERAVMALRALYARYGYSCYRMSKFEEYDLYAQNRDFLVSEDVIAFTDRSGKLMALKPDVTLSIIRRVGDEPGVARKVFYDEKVYRVPRGARAFREITQVGLECIGAVDEYCVCEVLTLAAESLRLISESCVLDVAHLGIIASVLDTVGASQDCRRAVVKCVGEKNLHELSAACSAFGVPEAGADVLRRLVTACGSPDAALPQLREILDGWGEALEGAAVLEGVLKALDGELSRMVRVDLSVVNDLNYYNGIVFRGFVEGVPAGVLSGGRYDRLARKMGRTGGAIGFAVYLDQLERLDGEDGDCDADVLLLYEEGCDPAALGARVRALVGEGRSVMAQRTAPERLRFREVMRFEGGKTDLPSSPSRHPLAKRDGTC